MIWNVWTSRRPDAQLLGMVNERTYVDAEAEARAVYGLVYNKATDTKVPRTIVVEPSATYGGPLYGGIAR